ncbi:MAG: SDR family NAD(P)-dependent oxidoreductase [Myxococcales bacterium]|nr:SDR family NAD(P)-dependent oxidoreductase [Myxococcales bacterium]
MTLDGMTKALLLLGGAGIALSRIKRARRRLDFAGRSVVIAGGSRGLGLAIARQLVDEGADVTLLARDRSELDRATNELEERNPRTIPLGLVCDVTDRAQVDEAIRFVAESHGRIDVLLNVAGVIQVGPWEQMAVEDYENAFAVHFWGPLHTMRAVIPHMSKRGLGRIANISSVGGAVGVPHLLPYASSKSALIGLSDGLRAELVTRGIRVTTVVPGLMRTGSHVKALFKGQQEKEYAWFATADATPGISLAADKAARRVIEAVRFGDFHVAIGWPARMAELMQGLAPGFTAAALALGNRLLPGPSGAPGADVAVPGGQTEAHRQAEARGSVLTANADQAIGMMNQDPQRSS